MNEIEKAIEQLDVQIKSTVNTVSIKSCKLAISALEKQIPKKPTENLYFEQDGDGWHDEGETYSCSACEDGCEIGRYSKESSQWIFEIKKYCPNCGQAIEIDWSAENFEIQ